MDRNLALEFVRVTEAAAIASARWVGKGNKNSADGAATDAMRKSFNDIDFHGRVVIGEGEMDEAPMLYIGEEIGTKKGREIDIAVDPLEGTNMTAKGHNNAMSVLAAGPKGTLLHAPECYMDKIAVGPGVIGVDLDNSVEDNIKAVAKSLKKPVEEVTVIMLERERHEKIVKEVRRIGARIFFIGDGDIAAAIAPALSDSPVDILLGIGAAPEGVIGAAAIKCLGGFFQGRLVMLTDEQKERAKKMGITDLNKKFSIDDLAKGDELLFVATGVTDGTILKGVTFTNEGAVTQTLVISSKTKTVRSIITKHYNNK